MINIFYDNNEDMWAAEYPGIGHIGRFKSIKTLVRHVRSISPSLAEENNVDIASLQSFMLNPDALERLRLRHSNAPFFDGTRSCGFSTAIVDNHVER